MTDAPYGERVVAMTSVDGVLYVATDRKVYKLEDGVLYPLEFALPEARPR
jgi:hypothetical protein